MTDNKSIQEASEKAFPGKTVKAGSHGALVREQRLAFIAGYTAALSQQPAPTGEVKSAEEVLYKLKQEAKENGIEIHQWANLKEIILQAMELYASQFRTITPKDKAADGQSWVTEPV